MKTNMRKAAVIFLAALLGGFISLGAYKLTERKIFYSSADGTPGRYSRYTIGNITVPSFDFTAVSELITPAVVHIKTKIEPKQADKKNGNDDNPMDLWNFFNHGYPMIPQGPQQASGSGVIITNDGYIITNSHVIEGADKIDVVLNDKRTFEGKVIGVDKQSDLAVLKIKTTDLPFVTYGNSDSLKVGEWVVAVGNPFNLTSTVTAGIVSAKGRNLNLNRNNYAIESFIQTDAAVNPGNSGGALVNIRGQLVGINTAIASETGQFIGYSFAIPSNIVRKVVSDILKFGKVQRGILGVQISEVTDEVASKHHMDKPQGVLVSAIMENSAAGEAGIKKNDIIIKIDNVNVNSVSELQEQVSYRKPGDKVQVTVVRDEKEKVLEVTLKDAGIISVTAKIDESEIKKMIGAEFESLSASDLNKMGIENGIRVKSVGEGKFRDAGIPKNFVILKIDKQKIYKEEDIYNILGKTTDGVLIEGINPDGSRGYYGFGLE
jgi:serine protease Do